MTRVFYSTDKNAGNGVNTRHRVIRIAPLGDPIEIRVRGTDLSLRKNEVPAIQIERLEHQTEMQKIDLPKATGNK